MAACTINNHTFNACNHIFAMILLTPHQQIQDGLTFKFNFTLLQSVTNIITGAAITQFRSNHNSRNLIFAQKSKI